MIGGVAETLAKPAAASPLAGRISGLLAQLGLGGKLKAVAASNDFAAELAEIENERSRIGGFDAPTLAANSRRKLALVERQPDRTARCRAPRRRRPRGYRQSHGFGPVDEASSENADSDFWARLFGNRGYTDNFAQLADALWSSGDRGEGQRAAAFAALQEAMTGATSRAVAKAATDRIAKRAGVAPLLAQRRVLAERIAALQQQSSAVAAKSPLGRERGRQISLLLDDVQRQTQARAQLDLAIRSAAPEYFPMV